MNTQTTCKRCGKTVGCSEWDIHTCTPPAQPATEKSSEVQPAPVHFAWMRYEEDCAGDPVLVLSRSTEEGAFRVYKEPAPEQYAALEQALTRLQKRYGELEARLAAQPTTKESSAVQPAPVQSGLDADCIASVVSQRYTTPPAAPVQSLPFGVGGGLVAIKTLLSRDPCAHATVAIQMIDAILAEHSPQKANTP